ATCETDRECGTKNDCDIFEIFVHRSFSVAQGTSVAVPLPGHPLVGRIAPATTDTFVFAAVDRVIAAVTGGRSDGADLRLHIDQAGIHPRVADRELRKENEGGAGSLNAEFVAAVFAV